MSDIVKDLRLQAESETVRSVSIFGGTSGLGEPLSGLLYRAADEIEHLRSVAGAVSRGPSQLAKEWDDAHSVDEMNQALKRAYARAKERRGARPDGTMASPGEVDHLRTGAAVAAGTMPSGEVGNGGE